MKAMLHTDGGARGNPGPAGIGYVLAIAAGPTLEHQEYIGVATNNQAEYRALIAGLTRAHAAGVTHLECFLDSELVVQQLNGRYRVKNRDLKELVASVKEIAAMLEHVSYSHIPRAKNARADKLVNAAIDSQTE